MVQHARDWLPLLMLRAARCWRGNDIRFEGEFATWQEAAARCTGYDAAPILEKVLEATRKVKRGEAPFRGSELFHEPDPNWPGVAVLLWATARCGGLLILEQVVRLAPHVIVVDRTIVSEGDADRVYVQTVPASIYSASYPCRSLSERGPIAALSGRYRLVSSFPSLEFPTLQPIPSKFRGYLFHKASE